MRKYGHEGNAEWGTALAVAYPRVWPSLLLVMLVFVGAPLQAAWQAPVFSDQAVVNGAYGHWWQARNDSATSPLNTINAVLVDSEQMVISAGIVDAETGSVNLHVARHNNAGQLQWQASYDGGAYDEGLFVFQDAGGNVLVVGTSNNESAGEIDVVVIKYSIGGVRLWAQIDNVTGSLVDVRAAMGPQGQVYVAATHEVDGYFEKDIVLLQFEGSADDSAGVVTQVGVSYKASMSGGAAKVAAIAVAADGGVIVAGTSDEDTRDIVLLKFNSTTNWQVLSSSLYPDGGLDLGQANDGADAVYVDGDGNSYVVGWTVKACGSPADPGQKNLLVMKVNASGVGLWLEPVCYRSPLGLISVSDIVVDASGNLFIGGQVGSTSDNDALLLAFDSDGEKLWEKSPRNGVDDVVSALALASDGSLFAVGSGNSEALMLRYDVSGAQQVMRVTALAGGRINALALGLDGYGNTAVYAGGASSNDVTNDSAQRLLAYGVMQADLQPLLVDVPAVGAYGTQINVVNSITNAKAAKSQALGVAGSFDVGFYLWPAALNVGSAAPLLGDLITLGQRTISGLALGQVDSANTPVSLLATAIPSGDYHVVVMVDGANAVSEYDQGNNMLVDADTIDVFDPPDLIMAAMAGAVAGPAEVLAGANMNVDYIVSNIRAVATAAFDVAFVLSLNTIYGDGDDVPLAGLGVVSNGLAAATLDPDTNTIVPALYSSASSGVPAVVTVPANITPERYYLMAVADSNNVIVEADETNNVTLPLYMGEINVLAIPDLSVQSVSGPVAAVVGSDITVAVTIYNAVMAGNVVQDFTVTVYLSADGDNVITAEDLLLGAQPVVGDGSLMGDGVKSVDVLGRVPLEAMQQSYYLVVVVDSTSAVIESDETNNVGSSMEAVVVGFPAVNGAALPDLMVTAVSMATTDTTDGIARGDVVSVTATVENVLPTAVSSAFQVGIYLSTDAVITSSDQLIGQRSIASLGGYSADISTVDVTIPSEDVQAVKWTNVIGSTVQGDNTLVLNNPSWVSGASSTQILTGNGAIEFTTVETDKTRYFGFSVTDSATDRSDFTHAVGARYDKTIVVLERNFTDTQVQTDLGAYVAGDVFTIERASDVVTYKRNGAVIYTSPYPSTGPVIADTGASHAGSTIVAAKIIAIQVAAGTYYLGVIVDDTAVVAEVDESNNSLVKTDSNGDATSNVISVQAAAGVSSGGGSVTLFSLIVLLLTLFCMPAGARIRRGPFPLA